jgi:hypothetical protein
VAVAVLGSRLAVAVAWSVSVGVGGIVTVARATCVDCVRDGEAVGKAGVGVAVGEAGARVAVGGTGTSVAVGGSTVGVDGP